MHLYVWWEFFTLYFRLYIHDLLLFDIPFISPFVYIDNRDFLREKGEVVLVLEIRERPSAWGRRKLCLFTYLNTEHGDFFALIKRSGVL